MSESLFDTSFEKQAETITELDTNQVSNDLEYSQHGKDSSSEEIINPEPLPSLSSNESTLINYRILISSKESGCLIGQNGQVINSIRQETNTKAGISKLLPGTNERILTVSGTLDNCSKAISYFAQALIQAQQEDSEPGSEFNYFPLKQLSLNKNIPGETTILRLLIPNNQIGTIIGSKGYRIQKIQNDYNISMIASKSFLPNSNERLVELQGRVVDLYNALRIISRCLMEDFSSIVGTNYYVPRPKRSQLSSYSYPGGAGTVSGTASGRPTNPRTKLITTTLSFNNSIVGALIGKNGSRIQGVRKISGAIIGISDELEGKDERIFTISGTNHAVEKAKSLLYHNLEREEQRRNQEASS